MDELLNNKQALHPLPLELQNEESPLALWFEVAAGGRVSLILLDLQGGEAAEEDDQGADEGLETV